MRTRRKSGGRRPAGLDRRTRASLLERLRADARRIASHFRLHYAALEAEDARVKRRYGSCHEDGRIKIRLTHARTGRALKYSSMIDTLCHELAHLKYFHHGPRFRDYYFRILDWARRQGIYRPAPRPQSAASTTPPALSLFALHPQPATRPLRRTARARRSSRAKIRPPADSRGAQMPLF